MKFIQLLSFVKRNFNFDQFSFVIKIALDVWRAVELVNTMPILGFFNNKVDVEIADHEPIKLSAIINNTFFLYKFLYFFL